MRKMDVMVCDEIVQTGFGCPTVFEWKDVDDENEYYFRLRNGCWRVENQTTGEVVCSGSSDEFDGVCSEQDMRDMVLSEGLYLLIDRDAHTSKQDQLPDLIGGELSERNAEWLALQMQKDKQHSMSSAARIHRHQHMY